MERIILLVLLLTSSTALFADEPISRQETYSKFSNNKEYKLLSDKYNVDIMISISTGQRYCS